MIERRQGKDRRKDHHGHFSGHNRRSEAERRLRRHMNPKLRAFVFDEPAQGLNINTRV